MDEDKQQETIVDFAVDELDPQALNQLIWKNLNDIVSLTNRLVLQYRDSLIYRLVKNGHVKMADLEKDAGISKERIYHIVAAYEKKTKELLEKENAETV